MVTSSPRNAPTYNPFAPKSVNGVFNNGGNGYQWADPNAPRKVRPTNLFGNDTPGAASRNAAQNFLNQGQQGLQPTINPEPFASQSIAPEVNLANLTPKFQDIWIDPIRQQAPVNTQQNAMQALNAALQRRAQQARMDVDVRRQEQVENGQRGYQPYSGPQPRVAPTQFTQAFPATTQLFKNPEYLNSSAATGSAMFREATKPDQFTASKAVPGIGTAYQRTTPTGTDTVVTGRYGTGVATTTPPKERFIMEDGKKVPIASWFKDAARNQGESNKFYSKGGVQMTDKV